MKSVNYTPLFALLIGLFGQSLSGAAAGLGDHGFDNVVAYGTIVNRLGGFEIGRSWYCLKNKSSDYTCHNIGSLDYPRFECHEITYSSDGQYVVGAKVEGYLRPPLDVEIDFYVKTNAYDSSGTMIDIVLPVIQTGSCFKSLVPGDTAEYSKEAVFTRKGVSFIYQVPSSSGDESFPCMVCHNANGNGKAIVFCLSREDSFYCYESDGAPVSNKKWYQARMGTDGKLQYQSVADFQPSGSVVQISSEVKHSSYAMAVNGPCGGEFNIPVTEREGKFYLLGGADEVLWDKVLRKDYLSETYSLLSKLCCLSEKDGKLILDVSRGARRSGVTIERVNENRILFNRFMDHCLYPFWMPGAGGMKMKEMNNQFLWHCVSCDGKEYSGSGLYPFFNPSDTPMSIEFDNMPTTGTLTFDYSNKSTYCFWKDSGGEMYYGPNFLPEGLAHYGGAASARFTLLNESEVFFPLVNSAREELAKRPNFCKPSTVESAPQASSVTDSEDMDKDESLVPAQSSSAYSLPKTFGIGALGAAGITSFIFALKKALALYRLSGEIKRAANEAQRITLKTKRNALIGKSFGLGAVGVAAVVAAGAMIKKGMHLTN